MRVDEPALAIGALILLLEEKGILTYEEFLEKVEQIKSNIREASE
jgi:hypothetical protein